MDQRQETEALGRRAGQAETDTIPRTDPPIDDDSSDEGGDQGQARDLGPGHGAPVWWHRASRVGAVYTLVVLSWAVLAIMRRVDSALQQMGVEGRPAGSALDFPVSFAHVAESLRTSSAQTAVNAARAAWDGYRTQVTSTTPLRNPFDVASSVVVLDRCFIVLYAILLAIGLVTLSQLNGRMPDRSTMEQQRRRRVASQERCKSTDAASSLSAC